MAFDARLIVVAVFVTTLLIGFLKLRYSIVRASERITFLTNYNNRLVAFLTKPDSKDYQWLLQYMDETQEKLGSAGIIDHYRAPFGSFTVQNYQLLVNFIPKLHSFDSLHETEVSYAMDAFTRAIGINKRWLDTLRKQLWQPLKWLSLGVGSLISLPLLVLKEVGIISTTNYKMITGSRSFHLLSGLVSVIGILELLSTFVLGKSALVELLHSLSFKV